MKYIVCYSGGHSSALVAVEAVRKVGKENVILLNHDISSSVEHEDIKRFKNEVADFLGIKITYANMPGYENLSPLKVAYKLRAFKYDNKHALCTYNLKNKPYYDWLDLNYPSYPFNPRKDITILYGFDEKETDRIQRRTGILLSKGYKTDYPLAFWNRTITNIEELGIERPSTYKIYKHANCIGCLKAGKQHWYVVYCLRRDIFNEAVETEEYIGYSILKDTFLKDLIPKFEDMKSMGICPNDKQNSQAFWKQINDNFPGQMYLPCDCAE